MLSVYFDHAAASPLLHEAREAMLPFLTAEFGNPASLHRFGSKPKETIETARGQVAALIKSRPADIVFTASASESNNQAIKGFALSRRDKGNHIVVSAIEHVSVLEPLVTVLLAALLLGGYAQASLGDAGSSVRDLPSEASSQQTTQSVVSGSSAPQTNAPAVETADAEPLLEGDVLDVTLP